MLPGCTLNVTLTVWVLDPEVIVMVPVYEFDVKLPVAAEMVRVSGLPLRTVPLDGATESQPGVAEVAVAVATISVELLVLTCTVCEAGLAPPTVAVYVNVLVETEIVPVEPTIRVTWIDKGVDAVPAFMEPGAQRLLCEGA